MCGNALKPPPPGLLSSPAIITLLAKLPTELDKANYRLGDMFCASCHQSMDSYGLMLEKLDPIGNHRTMYAAADDPDPITESVDFSKFPGGAAGHDDHRAGRAREGERRQPRSSPTARR